MKRITYPFAGFTGLLLFFSLISTHLLAQGEEGESNSPYFVVISEDESFDKMPLKETSASVSIAGVIADVTVKQVYVNEGNTPIEAIYVFPGSSKSALYAMTMKVGERSIKAKIAETAQARATYEQAKSEGKSASLLEQKRPNIFQMNVANILPGDQITVELSYTELIVPTEGVYSFVYPTVVAPRYFSVGELTALQQDEAWVLNPYFETGEVPNFTFQMEATINAGLPIQKVESPSHKVKIDFPNAETSKISFGSDGDFGNNRDFILNYRLSDDKIQAGLLLYEGEEENFFLATVQPPKSVESTNIPPREYVFIVDVSGSMYGLPMRMVGDLMKEITDGLRPEDRFNLMLFSSDNALLSPSSVAASPENIEQALTLLKERGGSGKTNLLESLKKALTLHSSEGYSRTFVVITDGFVTVEQEAFNLIQENLGNANLFAIGIGQEVNRYLVEGMAHTGMGEPLVVAHRNDALEQAKRFKKYIESPVLTDIQVKYEGFEAYEIEPINFPDVMAERPVIIFGKYKGSPKGTIVLEGLTGNGQKYQQSLAVSKVRPTTENQSLRYLWARKKIQLLQDYQGSSTENKFQKEITELGLAYNLLTKFTSFIAVDEAVRTNQANKTVVQALPSVSNKRVVGSSATNALATGTASRSIGAGKVRILLPKSCKVYDGKVTINWHLTWYSEAIESDGLTYIVQVKDIAGKTLWETETTQTQMTLDLAEEKFANARALLKFQVKVKGNSSLQSEEYVFKKLKATAPEIAQIQTLEADNSVAGLQKMIDYLEEKKLYANALEVYHTLLEKDNSKAVKADYNLFVRKYGLVE